MTLDPEIARSLPAIDAGFPRVETMTGPDARAAIRSRLQQPANPEPVADVAELTVAGIPIRIYRPVIRSEARPPIVVFAHGGGFVFCDLDTHDGLCRAMANGLGAVVASVDYRLAPEHPWPAAAEDVYAVTEWAAENAALLGADADRLIVAGDSAGGNLAAVAALRARDCGGPEIACQALLYPVIAAEFATDSYRSFGTGHYNTQAAMSWYWDQYVPDLADRSHPYASPGSADPTGLPPAVVVTAGCDPLHSEGVAYAGALRDAGVHTIHRNYEGAIHGFMTMPSFGLAQQARSRTWSDIVRLTPRRRAPRPAPALPPRANDPESA